MPIASQSGGFQYLLTMTCVLPPKPYCFMVLVQKDVSKEGGGGGRFGGAGLE